MKKLIILSALLLSTLNLQACGCHDSGSKSTYVNNAVSGATSGDSQLQSALNDLLSELQLSHNEDLKLLDLYKNINLTKKKEAITVKGLIFEVEK